MEIDEFSILTDDLIDYSSLSEDTLKELALGEELFIATSALAQLATINSSLAAAVAADILSHLRGDRYLHAAAIETLFGIDKMRAIEYMKQAVTGEGDRYIFTTIVELAIENKSDFQSGLGWTVFRLLSDKIKSFKADSIDTTLRNSFLNLYKERLEKKLG